MGRTGTYLDIYKIRVAAAIVRYDTDNKDIQRILATSEGTRGLFSTIGGKVDPEKVLVSRLRLEDAIYQNRTGLLDVAEAEGNLYRAFKINPDRPELFGWFDSLIRVIDSKELRTQLLVELAEETGLELKPTGIPNSKMKGPYIASLESSLDPFTVYFEKLYSKDGVLISPVYFVKVKGNNFEINETIDKTIKKQAEKLKQQADALRGEGKIEEAEILLKRYSEVKDKRWFSSGDLIDRDSSSYALPSLAYIAARLVEKGKMNHGFTATNGNGGYQLVTPTRSAGGSTPGDAKAAGPGK